MLISARRDSLLISTALLFALFFSTPAISQDIQESWFFGKKDKPHRSENISLIVFVNQRSPAGVRDSSKLIRYRFHDGSLIRVEHVATNRVLSHSLDWTIEMNRFALNNLGQVYDFATDKFFRLPHSASAIFKIHVYYFDSFRRQLHTYDLATSKQTITKCDLRPIRMVQSSNKSSNQHWIYSYSPNFKYLVYGHSDLILREPMGLEKVLLKKVTAKSSNLFVSPYSGRDTSPSKNAQVPLLWLDDDNFITQIENGRLVKVHVNGTIEEVATINDLIVPNKAPTLYFDKAKRVIYHCGDSFVIDVRNKSFSRLTEFKLGNDFSLSSCLQWPFKRLLLYKGKPISSLRQFNKNSTSTSVGYVAAAVFKPFHSYHPSERVSMDPRKHNIFVWNHLTKKSIVIEIGGDEWVLAGWLTDLN